MSPNERRDFGNIGKKGETVMKDDYVWTEDPRVMLPIVLAILSPGIVKIISAIVGLF
jgi:hypothetical protein